MLGAFVRAFRTPDLRKKLLFTLGIIVLFRAGSFLPAPGVSVETIHDLPGHAPRTTTSTR